MIDKPIACGPMRLVNDITLEEEREYIYQIELEAKSGKPGTWSSRLVQVDITCPTDLLIPFLMRRDEQGRNQQTLLPITRLWYAGPELVEACLLGYKITRIYAYYRFRYFEVLYQSFIEKNYKLREKHPSGAMNLLPKFKMNSASGKGAQRNILMISIILIGAEMYAPRPATVTETKTIFSNGFYDQPLACMVQCPQTVTTTPFCLNATVWILSWSRVHMSRFMREIDGYRNVERSPKYGDTDSLFITAATALCASAYFFGKKLGQFKNEMPSCKIIALYTLAPKTYMKVFLATKYQRDGKCGNDYEKDGTPRKQKRISYTSHPEGRRVKGEKGPIELKGQYEKMLQVTCKGIPHYSKPYRAKGEYEVKGEKAQEVLDNLKGLEERRRDKKANEPRLFDHVHLRDRYHVYEEPGKEPRVFACFTEETFKAVLEKKASFTTVFGVMDRKLTGTNMEAIGIHLDYNSRKLSAEPYWDKGRREKGETFMTFPLGFNT